MEHISKILPQVLDEEGIRIHSTDEDTPTVGRVTVELVETNIMDSEIVQELKARVEGVEKLSDEWCYIVGTELDRREAMFKALKKDK